MILSQKINAVGDSTTMKIAQKAIEMKKAGIDLIDLSVGEPDFPTPENIKNAAKLALDRNQTKYTVNSGLLELREAIANKLFFDHNLKYSSNEIIVSTGAKQSIFNAIQVLIDYGDEVILANPNYVSYEQIVNFAGGVIKKIATEEKDGFILDAEKIKSAISPKTKMLILCNPSNPTGSVHLKKDLEKIAEVIEEKNIFVLVDEIYEKLIYDGISFQSFPALSEKIKNKTILINGFSKSYAMTGWRLGFAAANTEIISVMNKLQSHSTSNASTISQFAAIEALTGDQGFIQVMRDEFQRRRNYLHAELENITEQKIYKPLGAFYIFLNIKKYLGKNNINNSIDFASYILDKHKVAIVPGLGFGLDGYVRISYANNMEILEKAIERLKQAFKELSH
ncbi:MAG: pyridoxal phosphate-dependent aminotransferase [Ignavibacteriales bacterium]